MKLASWACCAASLLFVATGWAVTTSGEDLRHVTVAEVALELLTDTATTVGPAVIPAHLDWQRADLPFIGFKSKSPSIEPMARLWVRFVDQPAGPAPEAPRAVTYGAYLAIGYRSTAYVDGRRFAATDHSLSNDWNQPVLFVLPMQEHQANGGREIAVAFNCDLGPAGCAAPSLRIGALPKATKYYERQRLLRIEGPRICSLAM